MWNFARFLCGLQLRTNSCSFRNGRWQLCANSISRQFSSVFSTVFTDTNRTKTSKLPLGTTPFSELFFVANPPTHTRSQVRVGPPLVEPSAVKMFSIDDDTIVFGPLTRRWFSLFSDPGLCSLRGHPPRGLCSLNAEFSSRRLLPFCCTANTSKGLYLSFIRTRTLTGKVPVPSQRKFICRYLSLQKIDIQPQSETFKWRISRAQCRSQKPYVGNHPSP